MTQSKKAIPAEWEKHIIGYRGSNKSKAKYCQAYQLDQKRFQHYYRNWCEQRAKESLPSDFSPVVVQPASTVPVASKPVTSKSGIILELANGIRCQLHRDFCPVTLKQLMEVFK